MSHTKRTTLRTVYIGEICRNMGEKILDIEESMSQAQSNRQTSKRTIDRIRKEQQIDQEKSAKNDERIVVGKHSSQTEDREQIYIGTYSEEEKPGDREIKRVGEMKGKREELIVWEIERENIRREGRGR